MPKRIEYKNGELIGECIFLEEATRTNIKRRALFRCGCGNVFTSMINNVKSGNTISCGCSPNIGSTTHGLKKHPLYTTWGNMRRRCYNTSSKSYNRYGGRGITVCDEWRNDFKAFYDHVVSLPHYGEPGYTLDREENDEGYRPGNVRWADKCTQAANRRPVSSKYGFSGISDNGGRYASSITVKSERIYIGTYDSVKEAVEARNKYIKENKLNRKIQNYERELF